MQGFVFYSAFHVVNMTMKIAIMMVTATAAAIVVFVVNFRGDDAVTVILMNNINIIIDFS